jgi:hypothetical protein
MILAFRAYFKPKVVSGLPPGIGGGGRTRTYDLRIMSSEPPVADKQDKRLSSAESGKIRNLGATEKRQETTTELSRF